MQASTNLAIIDSRFALENEEMVQQCAALLAEILLDPDITDGKFNEKNTELEKQYLLDTIDAESTTKEPMPPSAARM